MMQNMNILVIFFFKFIFLDQFYLELLIIIYK